MALGLRPNSDRAPRSSLASIAPESSTSDAWKTFAASAERSANWAGAALREIAEITRATAAASLPLPALLLADPDAADAAVDVVGFPGAGVVVGVLARAVRGGCRPMRRGKRSGRDLPALCSLSSRSSAALSARDETGEASTAHGATTTKSDRMHGSHSTRREQTAATDDCHQPLGTAASFTLLPACLDFPLSSSRWRNSRCCSKERARRAEVAQRLDDSSV